MFVFRVDPVLALAGPGNLTYKTKLLAVGFVFFKKKNLMLKLPN